ncbi:hypothetical protein C8J56DRAFT_1032251 [Mycena floridula]|nr:hypothetical protein C8J56DRAFT_1032251 [Mycena floridula]
MINAIKVLSNSHYIILNCIGPEPFRSVLLSPVSDNLNLEELCPHNNEYDVGTPPADTLRNNAGFVSGSHLYATSSSIIRPQNISFRIYMQRLWAKAETIIIDRNIAKQLSVRMHLVPQSKHPGEEKNGEDNIAGGQKGKKHEA